MVPSASFGGGTTLCQATVGGTKRWCTCVWGSDDDIGLRMLSDLMACYKKNWKYFQKFQNHTMLGTNCFVLIYLYMLDILISRPDTGQCRSRGHGWTKGFTTSRQEQIYKYLPMVVEQ